MPTAAFSLTPRQQQAYDLLAGDAAHVLLYGGSRSGKTLLALRAIGARAWKAPRSRHAVLRFRFNAVKSSVVFDTWPKLIELCWPGSKIELNRSDWYAQFPNGSTVWFGGLDESDRVEKILGQEYSTIFLNECSQIPWSSRNIAVTRLAQQAMVDVEGLPKAPLKLRMFYDCNPPSRGHWTYRVFVQKVDPDTRKPLPASEFAAMQINPRDNESNLPAEYLASLASLSPRLQRRFLAGEFSDEGQNALFNESDIDKWRVLDGRLPDMVRVVVGVDPSGSGDEDNADNDSIGIVVAGLGTDGNAYLIEDSTVKAGPATWGRLVATAFDRHEADAVVAESNFGGEMVRSVIATARPRTPIKLVHASRGKAVRAEPIAALVPDGKVRVVGYLPELEEELAGFTQSGYVGERSPNRADAAIWALSELFPGVVKPRKQPQAEAPRVRVYDRHASSWMGM